MKKETWYVYLLECKDNTYYTGITKNLDKRMKAHQEKMGSKYVRGRGFKKLICSKECKNKSDALKLEYKIKQLPREEKINSFRN